MKRIAVALAVVSVVALAMAPMASAQEDGSGGEVDLSSGWVTSDINIVGELAAHPDLGVVVVGGIGEWPPQSPPAWYSPTGLTFEEVPFPAPTGDPIAGRDVAANENGFVAILINSVFASFSADGRTWEPIDLSGVAGDCELGVVDTDESTAGSGCYLAEVAAGPSGFVILGAAECDAFALYSADGRTWERSINFPENCNPLSAVSTDDGFVALGAPDLVISSADGINWTQVTAVGLPEEVLGRGLAQISALGDTLVVVATRSGPKCDYLPGTWHSNDGGATWTEGQIEAVGEPAPDDAGFQPEDIEVTEFGLVAVGPLVSDPLCNPAEDPEDSGLILVSNDGITWRQFHTEFSIRNVAVTSTGLIGSGTLGIATWNQDQGTLATTGGSDTGPLVIAGSALLLAGMAALSSRRRLSHRGALVIR